MLYLYDENKNYTGKKEPDGNTYRNSTTVSPSEYQLECFKTGSKLIFKEESQQWEIEFIDVSPVADYRQALSAFEVSQLEKLAEAEKIKDMRRLAKELYPYLEEIIRADQ